MVIQLWIWGACVCVREQFAQLSVMQADRVLDIMTESWQDNKLVSAAEARRPRVRARVSNPPQAEKLS